MQIDKLSSPQRRIWQGWILLGATLIGASALLRLFSASFGYDVDIIDMPLLQFIAGYCLVGLLVFAILPQLVRSSQQADKTRLLIFVAVAGLAMRLVQIGAEPVLEDDYNRYLWDGAVTASGLNPYSVSPEASISSQQTDSQLHNLSTEGKLTLERINYPQYRTIYPPVAQGAFTIAHWVAPYNLNAWRLVLLAAEIGSFAFIVATLMLLGRSPLWASLYWWNPVMIKEYANSAHMEPIVILPVAIAIYLVARARPLGGTALLTIAAGAKLWPVLLTAPLFRQLLSAPRRLIVGAVFSAVVLAAFAFPILNAGLTEDSGFVAYAQKWRASSAAYIVGTWVSSVFVPETISIGMAARALLGLGLGAMILASMRGKNLEGEQLIRRMFWIAGALYLLSPSQFPWYFGWVMPFLCLFPVRGLLLAGVLLPLHYLYFYLDARDLKHFYDNGAVWIMWLPVWGLLAVDFWRSRQTAIVGSRHYA